MFTLTIETDNAAFSDTLATDECARILREVADRMERGESRGRVRDHNGNTVGTFSLEE